MLTNPNRIFADDHVVLRRHFKSFFEDDAFREKYDRKLRDMMGSGATRLIIDMGDLLDFTIETPGDLGRGVLRNPGIYVPICELAVFDQVQVRQPEYLKIDYRTRYIHVGFEGPVGEIFGPRDVYARHLNTLIAVEGIVTRQSPLRPRMLESVHYCPVTEKFSRKEYRDQLTPMLDSAHLPTVNVIPRTDPEGHLLRTELGLSSFVDSQCAILQEAPESAPTGQLPRSLEVRLDDDLVDTIKPGDRVVVVGMYAAYTSDDLNKSFKTILLANHVYQQSLAIKVPWLLTSHEKEIEMFTAAETARRGPTAVLEILSRSIAPTIYGLSNEKKAVLLMLVGGVERKAHNTRVRGSINVLLVGEPSTAKSQLLRYVLNVVPLALSTTGKGSSGVGLTAAVAVDPYTGERSLSAGAMVLADRGVLCIDEFDKMSPQDRVAMHEAMEQQTVTIAKAGIHASLNARCSVLAAANPVYGFYSVKHKLSFNVGLPESLLSRFDLTFIILDQHSSEHNRRVGGHILHNHVTATPVAFNAAPTRTVVGHNGAPTEDVENEPTVVGPDGSCLTTNAQGLKIVPIGFLRRYLRVCQSRSPMLTDVAQRAVVEGYSQLRLEQGEQQGKDGFIVTTRTLESIIRLATAHAKLRLANAVTADDVEVALSLVRSSVYAGSHAADVRKDDRATKADDETPKGGAPFSSANDDQEPQARRGPLPEATATGPAHGVDPTTVHAIHDVLRSFQREQRMEVPVYEIRERLATPIDPTVIRRVLQHMDADFFTYVHASDTTEDTVYFV